MEGLCFGKNCGRRTLLWQKYLVVGHCPGKVCGCSGRTLEKSVVVVEGHWQMLVVVVEGHLQKSVVVVEGH